MCALALAVASVVLALPREYHIDCSGWPGVAVATFEIRITASDETIFTRAVEVQAKATPRQVRNAIESVVRKGGWNYRTVGEGILVLEGKKNVAICSVEFKSEDWKPNVRVFVVTPEKK